MEILAANPQNYTACTGGREISYLVIHYTGNLGDTARNNAAYFHREQVKASAHYFVDEREALQSVPDHCIAWHCGAKSYRHPVCRNRNSLGIEICMLDQTGGLRPASIARAAALARSLIARYKIPLGNILRHYDVTGKNCPAPMVEQPGLWSDFLQGLSTPEKEAPTMTQAEFDRMMEDYRRRCSPTYHTLNDVPEDLRGTVEDLLRCGALKGEPQSLALHSDLLRAIVIAKRYTDIRTGSGDPV